MSFKRKARSPLLRDLCVSASLRLCVFALRNHPASRPVLRPGLTEPGYNLLQRMPVIPDSRFISVFSVPFCKNPLPLRSALRLPSSGLRPPAQSAQLFSPSVFLPPPFPREARLPPGSVSSVPFCKNQPCLSAPLRPSAQSAVSLSVFQFFSLSSPQPLRFSFHFESRTDDLNPSRDAPMADLPQSI